MRRSCFVLAKWGEPVAMASGDELITTIWTKWRLNSYYFHLLKILQWDFLCHLTQSSLCPVSEFQFSSIIEYWIQKLLPKYFEPRFHLAHKVFLRPTSLMFTCILVSLMESTTLWLNCNPSMQPRCTEQRLLDKQKSWKKEQIGHTLILLGSIAHCYWLLQEIRFISGFFHLNVCLCHWTKLD